MNERPTKDEIEAARSPAGGFSRETLAKWGVPWPPPKGWKERLLRGEPAADAAPPNYTGPEPTDDEFDSRQHGLLAEPQVKYRKIV